MKRQEIAIKMEILWDDEEHQSPEPVLQSVRESIEEGPAENVKISVPHPDERIEIIRFDKE